MYAWAIAALIISSCFMYLVPLVPQTVMDGVLSENSDGVWALGQRAIELGGGREFLRAHLWIAGVCVLALMGLAGCFTYLRSRWAARASEAITRKVRDRLYDQLQHLPCLYHDRAETGDQVQRCTSDVETLRTFLATHVVEIGRAMIMMLVPIPLMLSLDVRMTLVSVVIIPPVVVFSYFFFNS